MFKELIFVDNNKNIPNNMTIVPAITFKLSTNWFTFSDNTLLIITPKVEKTIENPKTKNIVFMRMLILFILFLNVWSPLISFNVVPEIYAKNPGIIGNMHGAINDTNPAENAIIIVGSAMKYFYYFYFKAFLQFLNYLGAIRFYLGIYYFRYE